MTHLHEIDRHRCSGCGRCVAACPERLLTLEVSGYRKHAWLVAPARCAQCLRCVSACPVAALTACSPAPSEESS